jgi:flagellar protein FliL
MSHQTFKLLILLTLVGFLYLPPIASAEEPVEEDKPELMYYEIEPNILTFYQGTGRKIGYVVVQVNVAVRGQDNYDLIELHMPLLQDVLIKFFNRQDKSVIQPFSEREQLRLKAMDVVKEALKEEIGKDIVENVLFTNYVYQ